MLVFFFMRHHSSSMNAHALRRHDTLLLLRCFGAATAAMLPLMELRFQARYLMWIRRALP